ISMALRSMSIEKLVALKGQVEAALSSKVLEQRRSLESELSKLGRFQGGKSRRDLGRARTEATVADRGNQIGQEGRGFPYCRFGSIEGERPQKSQRRPREGQT